MGGVRVVSNRLPQVLRDLPDEMDQAVDQTAAGIADEVRAGAWVDTGVAVSTVKAKTAGPQMHSTVEVGEYRGRGFYVGFHEFGTSKMPARPVVGPAAHAAEPVLAREAAEAVRRAAR